MQNDNFNQLLQQHAKGYMITPSASAFDNVMQKRNGAKKKKRRIYYLFVASFIAVSSLTLATILPDAKSPGSETMAQVNKNRIETAPAVSSHVNTDSKKVPVIARKQANKPVEYIAHNEPVRSTPSFASKEIVSASVAKHEKGSYKVASVKNTVQKSTVSTAKQNSSFARESKVGGQNNTSLTPAQQSVDKQETLAATSTAVITQDKLSSELQGTSDAKDAGSASPEMTASSPVATAHIDSFVAATDLKKPLPHHKWAVSALFTPQFVNSVYSANSSSDLQWFNDYYTNKERNDRSRFSYNAGVKLERELSKHFSVSAGMLVSVIQFEELQLSKTLQYDTIKNPGLLPATVNTSAKTYDRNRFDISFTSLEFPVLANYNIHKTHVSYQFNAGVAYSYLLATRSLVFEGSDSLNARETNDAQNARLQQHHFMVLGGVNIAYHITPDWNVYAGPVFRYQLSSLYSKDYAIRQNPYFMGLEMGVKYSF